MAFSSLLEVIYKTWITSTPLNGNGFDTEIHIVKALDWLQQAQAHTIDGGVSKGYNLLDGRWEPSYPETTGYIIPTLFNAADFLKRADIKALALSLADYLLRVVTPEGGIAHWKSTAESVPIVFDTGQVIFGWLAAYRVSGNEQYLSAAKKAGDWLVSIQNQSGAWKQNQHLGYEKVIDTRVAWVLLELNRFVEHHAYVVAALRNLDWAIEHQHENGWFDHCAFTTKQNPLTHTIAYTIEGLLECGLILDEPRYIQAAKNTARALLLQQRRDGSLAGTFGSGWHETSNWSCLTGNCQMARIWLRLFELDGDALFKSAAEKAIHFVAKTQILNSRNPTIQGAIAGSFPISGAYERLKFPNWAAKFFIDALITQALLARGDSLLFDYRG